ncbi:MAG: hypothetical protein ACI9W0_003640 [Gammaproteobacteria bacterium]|jgi:hypothetical protein
MLREFQLFIGARLTKALVLLNAKPWCLKFNANK